MSSGMEMKPQPVGWVERSETHHLRGGQAVGFASLYPPYALLDRFVASRQMAQCASLIARPTFFRFTASGGLPHAMWIGPFGAETGPVSLSHRGGTGIM